MRHSIPVTGVRKLASVATEHKRFFSPQNITLSSTIQYTFGCLAYDLALTYQISPLKL